jgi:hypothetical protein
MPLLSLNRVLAALFLPALLTLACFAQTAPADARGGVQIEFPAGGQLQIENLFGDVVAESWNQRYVYVSTSQGAVVSKLSSVVIENRNQGFVIRVVRRPGAPLSPIDLTIKIPETARAEVVTSNGRVWLRGVPASATVKTVGGDVNVEFLKAADVDVSAKSVQGLVKSELPQLVSETGHAVQARLGTGAQTLRINSQT